jgi:hypothetical protein
MATFTAGNLEHMGWNQVVVRSCIDYRGEKARLTRITLLSACRDNDGNSFYYRVDYSKREPTVEWSTNTGLTIVQYPSAIADRQPELQKLVDEWRKSHPCWITHKQARGYERKADGTARRIAPGDYRLMQHYARLHTRLCYEAELQTEYRWFLLNTLQHRLEAFLLQMTDGWAEAINRLANVGD